MDFARQVLQFRFLLLGVYGFVFNRDSNWIYSIVDDHLYLKAETFEDAEKATAAALVAAHSTHMDMQEWYQMMYQTGSGALYFSQSRDLDETWLPLFEKAYAKVHGDYDALRWGYPGYARVCHNSFHHTKLRLVKHSKTWLAVFPHNCILGTSWTKIDSGKRNSINSILKSCSRCGPATTEDMVVLMPQPVHLSSGLTKAMGNGCFSSGLPECKCSRFLLIFAGVSNLKTTSSGRELGATDRQNGITNGWRGWITHLRQKT